MLACEVSGVPLPSVTWFKGGVVIENGGRFVIDEVSVVTQNERNISSTLTVLRLELSDTDTYYCTASNDGASDGDFSVVSDIVSITVQRTFIY